MSAIISFRLFLKGGSTNSKTESNKEAITRILANNGITGYRAAAILGTWEAEGGLDPTIHEYGQKEGRGGYGLAQWTGSRRELFIKDYNSTHAKKVKSVGEIPLKDLVEYALYEMLSRPTFWKAFTNAKNLDEATDYFLRGFENGSTNAMATPLLMDATYGPKNNYERLFKVRRGKAAKYYNGDDNEPSINTTISPESMLLYLDLLKSLFLGFNPLYEEQVIDSYVLATPDELLEPVPLIRLDFHEYDIPLETKLDTIKDNNTPSFDLTLFLLNNAPRFQKTSVTTPILNLYETYYKPITSDVLGYTYLSDLDYTKRLNKLLLELLFINNMNSLFALGGLLFDPITNTLNINNKLGDFTGRKFMLPSVRL